MTKRGNALMVLVALAFDVVACFLWYITLFPLEPISTLETVSSTLFAILCTVLALGLTYIAYDSCISEEE